MKFITNLLHISIIYIYKKKRNLLENYECKVIISILNLIIKLCDFCY